MKRPQFYLLFTLFFISALCLSACAGGEDAPAQAVELYYNALVEKDQDRLIAQTCADFELMALLEFDSFVSVETSLKDFSCQTVDKTADSARVTCQGAISASYQGEVQEFPLSAQTYLVVLQGGEWLLCGYE
jgi:hypothetical protein